MNWTDEQRAAIETRGSMIVSAAAGAGKTAVLTERLCALVAAGTDVSRLLVMTFTRAAAAEMKNRIAGRLLRLSAAAEEPALKRRLSAQAHAVTGGNISTIHAFCARVLRRHSHRLGLPSAMRIADEMELAALREQVQDELLTRFGEADDADWHTLLCAFGSEKRALETLLSAYAFILSQPAPFEWLENAVSDYADGDMLLTRAVSFAQEELALHTETLEAAADSVPEDWSAVRAVLDDDLSHARALALMDGYADYRDMLYDIAYETLRFPRGTHEAEKIPFREPRESYKALIKAQRQRFLREEEEEKACMQEAAEVLAALLRALRAYDEAFMQKKREKALLDYNDLERFTLTALEYEDVAQEYREKFDYVAVDEYQDSNRVQEAILARVSRGGNLFLVGDVKQSIYRFRQAEPALFLERLRDADEGRLGRVDLKHNFRSSRAVIDGVNGTFSALMSEEAGGICYDARARLVPGLEAEAGGAELHIIERESAEEDEDAHDAVVEARFAAERIKALMQEDPGLHFSDIAVLLQYSKYAMPFAATLAKAGVPCYAQSSGGYFDAIEVQLMLNLLRVIDNRRRDVPLLSVLRSSVGGFDDAALAAIRTQHPEGSFFEAATACAAGTDAQAQKLGEFFARLDGWRTDSLLLSVQRLIGKLLDETGLYEEVGVLAGGSVRQANLDALLQKARAFENSGARGLFAFLRHIEQAGRGASFGAAQAAAADVVRLLTVHKSKGLEFPVVFVCQLGARFVLTDGKEPLVLHGEYGAGLKYIDGRTRTAHDTAARKTLLGRVRLEEMAEEMRVLYVAMTRAKTHLILCGCLRGATDKLNRPKEKPLPAVVLGAGTPLEWLIMSGALKPVLHARGEWLINDTETAAPSLPAEDAAVTRALRARLDWRYPHAEALGLPAKTSVTQLGGRDTPAFEPPSFIAGEKPTALSLGTAMHTALQRLPSEPLSEAAAKAYVHALASHRLIGTEEAERLDAAALGWLSHTPLYARLIRSARRERELPFACAMDACALYDTAAEERVLLQGVIDACFMEDGGWVIMDYKTDAPHAEDTEEALASRHAKQLGLYAAALSALTGLPVKERWVVYLAQRKIVAC